MRKVIKLYIPFFVIVSLFAGIFYGINGNPNKDSNVSYDKDETYPEELRPQIAEREEEELEEEIPEEEEDLLSDEKFVNFEVEEETKPSEETADTNETTQTEENNQNEEQTQVYSETEQSSEQPTDENMIPANQVAADGQNSGAEVEIIPEKVNARTFPESSSKIIAVFEGGQRGVLIKEGPSWSVIKVGEHQGYVNNKFWKRI